jgi:hypothetical protein
MSLRLAALTLLLRGGAAAHSPAAAQAVAPCSVFRQAMVQSVFDLKPEFVRPLVVSRSEGSAGPIDTFDLVTGQRIDGALKCAGEKLLSFEAKIALPADARLLDMFERVQQSALVSALRWTSGHALSKVRALSKEAAENLRGSEERGDVAISGRVEEHAGNGTDIGLMWTRTDHSFVIITGQ